MKKIKILSLLILFTSFINIYSQKLGVVDTDYILNKLPEYKDAENRLNQQIETWRVEMENMQSDYDKKKSAFENEKVLLIGDQLKQRAKEVADLDLNIKNTLSLRYGKNGEIEKLQANLSQPFQDQIWEAIRLVSEKNGLGIVLDKSNDVNVIFLQKRYDYTDKVLNILTNNKGKNKNSK